MPPPRHAARRPSGGRVAENDLLHDLDVAVVVARHAPWQVTALQAAVAADLGPDWRGGALVVDDAAPGPTARAARDALADHHARARRTVLTLPRPLGRAGAADLALAELTGEYVALLDVTTRPAPGTLRTLALALDRTPDALWAAPPVPGLAVVRRAVFLGLGAFDPALRGDAAVADAGRRAEAAGWRRLRIDEARAHHDGRAGAGPRIRRPAPRRAWSGDALAAWLPRARLAAMRVDLP